jgi:5'-methylthioadenosine phosphorylase
VSGRLAIVGGHSLPAAALAHEGARRVDVAVPDAKGGKTKVGVIDRGDRIDNVANQRALVALGCDRVLAISSVGGLRRELAVGTFLAASDFIALHEPITALEDGTGHRVPGFDLEWRDRIMSAWLRLTDVPLRDGGIYWQAFGPRFETPAEIRYLAGHADVVGMTMASECILAGELGLRYAAVCVVDNLANGVGERLLTVEEFEAGKRASQSVLQRVLELVVPELAT